MMGGSVSSISGGAGNNTLVAQNGISNTWNINGTNSGSATNVTSFSSIQNATGGDSGNNFIFANNAAMTGMINGGSLSNTNTLNYNAYTTDVSVLLSATNDGITNNSASSNITNFTNINNLVGNANNNNFITLPNKTNTLTLTGAREGYINDPIFFSGFQSFVGQSGVDEVLFTVPATVSGNTVTINGITMFFTNFAFTQPPAPPVPPTPSTTSMDVAQIIQQQPANTPSSSEVALNPDVAQNINDILTQINHEYSNNLSQVKINPYCYTANN
jgi:hypothetical protein